jgi:hypothetical protein
MDMRRPHAACGLLTAPRAPSPPAASRMTMMHPAHFFGQDAGFYNGIAGRRLRPAIASPAIASGLSIRLAGDSFFRIRPLQRRPRRRRRGTEQIRVPPVSPG